MITNGNALKRSHGMKKTGEMSRFMEKAESQGKEKENTQKEREDSPTEKGMKSKNKKATKGLEKANSRKGKCLEKTKEKHM